MPFHALDCAVDESIEDMRTRVREAVSRQLIKAHKGVEKSGSGEFKSLEAASRSDDNRASRFARFRRNVAPRIDETPRKCSLSSTITGNNDHSMELTKSDQFILSKIVRTKALIESESRRLESLNARIFARKGQKLASMTSSLDSSTPLIEYSPLASIPRQSFELESLGESPTEVSSYSGDIFQESAVNCGSDDPFSVATISTYPTQSATAQSRLSIKRMGNQGLELKRTIQLKDQNYYLRMVRRISR